MPPGNFVPAGVLDWVRHSPAIPPFAVPARRRKGRRRSGELYERRVQTWLSEEFGPAYLPSPWFYFRAVGEDRVRWAQPDGLLFDFTSGTITIIEVKLQHTAAAWWQVKWLYHPLVAHVFPPDLWRYAFVEVVKWFDRDTLFPEKCALLPHIAMADVGKFGVHIWS